MSSWDEKNFGGKEGNWDFDEKQESHLLRTFHDYRNLQINEVKKLRSDSAREPADSASWTSRFQISALIHVIFISTFTVGMILTELLNSELSLMKLLSTNGVYATVFIGGYATYFVLIVSVSLTGNFYNFLENSLKKKIGGLRNLFAWIHLIGFNLGGAVLAFFLIFGAMTGQNLINSNFPQNNFEILKSFFDSPHPVFLGSILLLGISSITGVFLYFSLTMQNLNQLFFNKKSN